MLKYCSIFISLGLLLTACVPEAESAKQLATDLKDNIYETSYKVKEWAMTPPLGKLPPREVADSYCYRVLQDILCYRQPMPGWESRLVAYQGTRATTPPPAQMELMAKSKPDESAEPANKVASAKPVFTTLPTLPKGTDKSADPAATPDTSHDILPDPASAPEL